MSDCQHLFKDELNNIGLVCLRCGASIKDIIAELRAELEVAQGHARNHHLEACESCAVEESDNIFLRAENAALVQTLAKVQENEFKEQWI